MIRGDFEILNDRIDSAIDAASIFMKKETNSIWRDALIFTIKIMLRIKKNLKGCLNKGEYKI